MARPFQTDDWNRHSTEEVKKFASPDTVEDDTAARVFGFVEHLVIPCRGRRISARSPSARNEIIRLRRIGFAEGFLVCGLGMTRAFGGGRA